MNRYLKNAEFFTQLLDNQFSIFGFRFGLEPIVGLVPGLGDVISLFLSGYLVWVGVKMRVPRTLLIKMLFNLAVDFFLGTIPVIGDVTDFFYKANVKNLEILRNTQKSTIEDAEIVS